MLIKGEGMNKLLQIFLLISVVFLAACGGSSGGGTTPDPVGDTGEPEPEKTTSMTLDNQSGVTVAYFYISPASSSNWGPDQLRSQVVLSGREYTVTSLPCGSRYDVKVEAIGRNLIAKRT